MVLILLTLPHAEWKPTQTVLWTERVVPALRVVAASTRRVVVAVVA